MSAKRTFSPPVPEPSRDDPSEDTWSEMPEHVRSYDPGLMDFLSWGCLIGIGAAVAIAAALVWGLWPRG